MCDDDTCDGDRGAWVDTDPFPGMIEYHPWTWRYIPIITSRVVADSLTAAANGLRVFADCLVGVTANEDRKLLMHEQTTLEIETITATTED